MLRGVLKVVLPRPVRDVLRPVPQSIAYGRGTQVMSKLRQWWVIARHPHATIRFGRNVYVGPGFSLFIPTYGTFIAGDNVEFRRQFRAEVHDEGVITIGDDSHLTYSVVLQCTRRIDIGARCTLAQSTTVVDGEHRFRDLSRPMLEQGYDFTPVTIGDDAFIAAKSTVMADVGERAVVGANSVVTRPVPAYTVAVGSPAKPIEFFGPE